MKSPDEYDKLVERIERQVRDNDTQRANSQSQNYQESAQEVQIYKTVKHEPAEKGKLTWKKKAILGLKLFGLGVAALVAVRVAAILAYVVIVAALGFLAYKLFFDNKNK